MHRVLASLALVLVLAPASLALAEDASAVELRQPGVQGNVGAMSHVWQTLNNCGPASVVMALSTMGYDVGQDEARLALRGDDIRRGMPAQNVDPWVRMRFGLRAVARTNGTPDQVKRFIANGFPVIVTQWLEDPPSRIAHYRVVRGYDDAAGAFYVNDPMRGANVALPYDWFVENWKSFSYRYLVLYQPDDEARVKALVGADWDEVAMRQRLYERARLDATRSASATAWLGFGEAAYQYGKFGEAVAAFEKGLALGSPRGVFTLRVSYPMSLRLVHREAEAASAFETFATLGAAPLRVPDLADQTALQLFETRAERFRAE